MERSITITSEQALPGRPTTILSFTLSAQGVLANANVLVFEGIQAMLKCLETSEAPGPFTDRWCSE